MKLLLIEPKKREFCHKWRRTISNTYINQHSDDDINMARTLMNATVSHLHPLFPRTPVDSRKVIL